MIAEPYICIKGPGMGDIRWMFRNADGRLWMMVAGYNQPSIVTDSGVWVRFDIFEREKLKEVCKAEIGISITAKGYTIDYLPICVGKIIMYNSRELTGYADTDLYRDSESNRLLKRAEFLKAVCEKEGVEFLPKNCGSQCILTGSGYCEEHGVIRNPHSDDCKCHKPEQEEEPASRQIGYYESHGCGCHSYKCAKHCQPKEEKCCCPNCGRSMDADHSCSPAQPIAKPARDYYTKAEEREWRRELLSFIERTICDVPTELRSRFCK